MVDVSPTGQPVYIGDLATVDRVYKDPSEYAESRRADHSAGGRDARGQQHCRFGNTLRATLKAFRLPSPDVKLDMVADQPRSFPTASAISSRNLALPSSLSSW